MAQAASDRSVQRVNSQWVDIEVGNHHVMQAYMARPDGEGSWPAVIVLMEIFGVNAHIRSVTERIAAEGYVAIAPNYYHRTTKNLELGYTDRDVEIGRQNKDVTTRDGLLVDIRSVIQFLQTQKEVEPKSAMGCIGFCFGGHVAYIAASMKEIVATASFYGAGIATGSPGGGEPTVAHTAEIEGEILCLFGEDDSSIDHKEMVAIGNALKAAGVRHEIIRYANTGHGFFCDQRGSYDNSAAEDAWHRVKTLFSHALQGDTTAKAPASKL